MTLSIRCRASFARRSRISRRWRAARFRWPSMAAAPSFASTLTNRLKLDDDCALGIALKIDDGSMTRGRNPVILKTLELLGFDIAAKPELQRYREWPLRNVVGTLVGEVRAEFELEFL